jgi:hypothetical protein
LTLAAAPALATPPQRSDRDFSNGGTIDCSAFNPTWTFNDDFVDFFHERVEVFFDAAGNTVRLVEHVEQTSNDVNSVTGFTLHEHNHYTIVIDLVDGTMTINGAINNMQRRGLGEVIQNTGHKIFEFPGGEPLALRGPTEASDANFCAAIAP